MCALVKWKIAHANGKAGCVVRRTPMHHAAWCCGDVVCSAANVVGTGPTRDTRCEGVVMRVVVSVWQRKPACDALCGNVRVCVCVCVCVCAVR